MRWPSEDWLEAFWGTIATDGAIHLTMDHTDTEAMAMEDMAVSPTEATVAMATEVTDMGDMVTAHTDIGVKD